MRNKLDEGQARRDVSEVSRAAASYPPQPNSAPSHFSALGAPTRHRPPILCAEPNPELVGRYGLYFEIATTISSWIARAAS